MTFCRDRFSSNAEQTSDVQQEHAFDDIPFADVATQQRDRRPPIREILLTGSNLSISLFERRLIPIASSRLFPSSIETRDSTECSLYSWQNSSECHRYVHCWTRDSSCSMSVPLVWYAKCWHACKWWETILISRVSSITINLLVGRRNEVFIYCPRSSLDE